MATEIQIHAKQVRVNSSLLSLHHLTRLRAATERKELTFPQRSLETNQYLAFTVFPNIKAGKKTCVKISLLAPALPAANELLGRTNLTFCCELASSRLHSHRAYPAPGRQGKANTPYSGTAFLNNPLYPLMIRRSGKLSQIPHFEGGRGLYGSHSSGIGKLVGYLLEPRETKENTDDEKALLFFVYCFVYLFSSF